MFIAGSTITSRTWPTTSRIAFTPRFVADIDKAFGGTTTGTDVPSIAFHHRITETDYLAIIAAPTTLFAAKQQHLWQGHDEYFLVGDYKRDNVIYRLGDFSRIVARTVDVIGHFVLDVRSLRVPCPWH